MATCPICRTSISWVKVLQLNRWNYHTCESCGMKLQINKIRAISVVLFFAAPILVALYIEPVPIEVMRPWFIFWVFLLLLTWIFLAKLEPVSNQTPLRALDPLPDKVPGQTVADEILQLDIVHHIAFEEGASGSEGFQGRVLSTRSLTPTPELIPEKARKVLEMTANIAAKNGREQIEWWREEWVIDRNSKNIYYEIILIANWVEGVEIVTGLVQESPFST